MNIDVNGLRNQHQFHPHLFSITVSCLYEIYFNVFYLYSLVYQVKFQKYLPRNFFLFYCYKYPNLLTILVFAILKRDTSLTVLYKNIKFLVVCYTLCCCLISKVLEKTFPDFFACNHF